MLNRVILVGRLTRDPDLRYTPNGVAVANFNIAVNRPFTDANGERTADFINGVVWRRQAENLANYMKKGSLIGVDGRLQTRTYEGQDGKTVYVTEVVADSIQFLESKSSQSNQSNHTQSNNNQGYGNQGNSNPGFDNQEQYAGAYEGTNIGGQGEPIDISDDDLPF